MKDIPANDHSGPLEERAWARTAFYVQWKITHSATGDTYTNITLICFGAVKHFRQSCMHLRTSQTWESILKDPYVLVGYFLESWYERVDIIVWTLNQRGSTLEQQTLESSSPASLANPKSEFKLEHL